MSFNFNNKIDCFNCNCVFSAFSSLSKDEISLINDNHFELNYKAGETILKQGSQITHLMVLKSGFASVYFEVNRRTNLIINILQPGQLTGGPGLGVNSNLVYSAKAITDISACFIDISVIHKLLRQNSDFAMHMLKYTNENLLVIFDKLVTLGYKQMNSKIAEALLHISRNILMKNPFKMIFSRQLLAEMTGLSKESVIRVLKKFKDDKLILESDKMMELLDVERLEQISQPG